MPTEAASCAERSSDPEDTALVNKTLRLLIAENCHAQSLLLERMLNRLSYHRIAIATSLSEACLLGPCTGHPFDVLICNARLLASEPLGDASLAGICHSALVYRSQHLPTERALLPVAATLARLPGALDAASLGAFMMLIDPRALPPKKTIRRA